MIDAGEPFSSLLERDRRSSAYGGAASRTMLGEPGRAPEVRARMLADYHRLLCEDHPDTVPAQPAPDQP
jgi:hypothetical protein